MVISPDFASQLQRLEEIFKELQDVGLKLKSTKCELLQNEVHYLSHVVNTEGVSTNPEKVAAIHEWKR